MNARQLVEDEIVTGKYAESAARKIYQDAVENHQEWWEEAKSSWAGLDPALCIHWDICKFYHIDQDSEVGRHILDHIIEGLPA